MDTKILSTLINTSQNLDLILYDYSYSQIIQNLHTNQHSSSIIMVIYEEDLPVASSSRLSPNKGSIGSFRSRSRSRSSQNLFQFCHRSDDSDDDLGMGLLPPSQLSNRDDVEGGHHQSESVDVSRRRSTLSHLYTSLQRRRSMSRLTPLSISLSSVNGPVRPVGQDIDVPDDEEEEEEEVDQSGNEDSNNNPLDDFRDHPTISTNDRTLKITPSIVRMLPTHRRQSKYAPGRIRKRVIHKNGNVNLSPEHVDKRHRRFIQDMFTTMVDIRWRWNLLVFTMGFLLSWFGFAVVWWLIAFSHQDFEHAHDPDWTPCVNNLKSFASAILFSIETQHTIGE